MSLTDQLRTLGSRLGLVHIQPATNPQTPVKISTRVVTLDQLRAGIRSEHVEALAQYTPQTKVDLNVPFDAIDAAADIRAPKHGWTAEFLVARLRRDDLTSLPSDQAKQVLFAELAAAGAPPEDVVRDAVARDQAIDTFAITALATLRSRASYRDKRRQEIAATLAQLRREDNLLAQTDAQELAAWQAWWQLKLARERTLATAVGALVEHLPVTVDELVPPLH